MNDAYSRERRDEWFAHYWEVWKEGATEANLCAMKSGDPIIVKQASIIRMLMNLIDDDQDVISGLRQLAMMVN